MARKTLLTEAQVRQFMKLAELPVIGAGRLEEMGYQHGEDPTDVSLEEQEEEEAEMADEEVPMDDMDMGGEEDADAGLEMDADLGGAEDAEADMDMDMDMGAEAGGDKEDDFMNLVQQLADLVGVEVDMDAGPEDAGAEADMEMDADLGGEEELDMGGEEELDMGGEEEVAMDAEEEEEVPGMRDMYENQDALVSEVARRVAARLAKDNDKKQLAEELAEKILSRLTATK